MIARRGRRVAVRQGMAGHWSAQSSPMFSSGRVGYEVAGHGDVTEFGGIAALHRLVCRLGLPAAINERLSLLKVHLPYSESDHVLNLAYNVAVGGKRLEDIERLRHDVAYMNAIGTELVPDPTTAGDFCRRFSAEDVGALMDAVNAVRVKVWRGRGAGMLGPVAYLDVDGTDAPTGSQHAAGVDISYKGVWGYAPLLVSLANTREVLFLVNRPGNVPSHAGAAAWIDKAIALVSPYAPRVCLRGDTDFSLTANFDRWSSAVDFVLGMDASPTLVGRAQALDESAWALLTRPGRPGSTPGKSRARRLNHKKAIVATRGYVNLQLNCEHVAEFDYQPGKCAQPYRVVVVRKNITKSAGETALIDQLRYFFYITTRQDLSAAQVVACANARCDQENINAELKNGVNALRVPLYDLVSNWAYMVAAALTLNIKSWFAMMMRKKSDRRAVIGMEYRQFLNEFIAISARVIQHARSTTIRVLGYTRALNQLFTATTIVERTRFG